MEENESSKGLMQDDILVYSGQNTEGVWLVPWKNGDEKPERYQASGKDRNHQGISWRPKLVLFVKNTEAVQVDERKREELEEQTSNNRDEE